MARERGHATAVAAEEVAATESEDALTRAGGIFLGEAGRVGEAGGVGR